MSFHTNPLVIGMRSLARRMGVIGVITKLRPRRGYEESFDEAMMAAIKAGDRVWDVGANVGVYTTKFAEQVGPSGAVLAFEPSPRNAARLREAVGSFANVHVIGEALGAEEGALSFVETYSADGVDSGVSRPGRRGGEIQVPMTTADLIVAGGEAAPNLIKIDVEGFEMEVIEGMTAVLRDAALRTLCIEVHFTQLADRGLAQAPRRIESSIRDAGFAVRWVDASHIVATKRA